MKMFDNRLQLTRRILGVKVIGMFFVSFLWGLFFTLLAYAGEIDLTADEKTRQTTRPELASLFDQVDLTSPEMQMLAFLYKWTSGYEVPVTVPERLALSTEEKRWISQHPEITLGFATDFEPLLFVGDEGQLTGMMIDIYSELEMLTGIRINYEIGSWLEIIEKVKIGEIDGLVASAESLAKAKGLLTTKPITTAHPTIFTRMDAPFKISRLADLHGKRVAVIKGIYMVDQALFPHRDKLELIETDSAMDMLRLILERKADVAVGLHYHNYLINKHMLVGLKAVFIDYEHIQMVPGSIRAEWPEYITLINKAIDRLGRSRINEISQKWIQTEEKLLQIKLSVAEQKWLEQNPVLRIGFDIDWPPVEMWSEQHGYSGISADYISRIEKNLGVKIEPAAPRDWKTTLEAARSAELEILSAVARTPQRDEYLNFTEPYLRFPIVIVTREGVSYIGEMEELHGKKAGVLEGHASHDYLRNNHPHIVLAPSKDTREGLLSVLEGESFAFIGSMPTVMQVMAREGIGYLKISGETPYTYDLSIGISKGQPLLLSAVQKALDAIPEAERVEIYRKWLSITVQQRIDYTLIWQVIAAVVIVLTLFLYWNRRLTVEVAQRKQAETLAQAAREAAELEREAAECANQAKSIFLANMSHELRTPLNAILGFSEILGRAHDTTEIQHKQLSIINRSGEHLLAMVNDVLDLSKIEAGHVVLEEKIFDLPILLLDIGSMFEMRAEGEGISFSHELDSSLPRFIRCDVDKLREILINLLGNAVKFTREGGVSLRAKQGVLAADPSQVTLKIEVEDSGSGIAPEQLDNVFKPFVQAGQSVSNVKGTGLGLTITKSFVDLMGGDISVESNYGIGTIFHVELPVTQLEEAETVETENARPEVIGLDSNQPTWRILIVEDSEESRMLLSYLLLQVNFDIREAENGKEAVELFEEWQPHFIWMDMNMPVMDGYEAIEKIRRLPGGRKVKVVALTASAFKEQNQKILDSGCDEVLYKPFRTREIFNSMKQLLGVRYQYKTEKENKNLKITLTTAIMNKLPIVQREDLKQAAICLDIEATSIAIDAINSTHPEIGDELRILANEYQFGQILELLEVKEGDDKERWQKK